MSDPVSARGGCARTVRRNVLIVLAMFGLSALCGVGVTVVVDAACVSLAQTWIPPYPGSEVASESYTGWRPFGFGVTTRTLETPIPPAEVRNWYNRVRREAGTTPPAGLALMNFRITENSATGGSRIVLSSQCAWSS